jgi:hypothetical protein
MHLLDEMLVDGIPFCTIVNVSFEEKELVQKFF